MRWSCADADPQRLDAVARLDDAIAEARQRLAREIADGIVVFDEEHGLRSPQRRFGAFDRRRDGRRRHAHRRQRDRERRALARLALGPDVTRALPDDAVDGGEAEAGALADLLRREERLEEVRPHVRRHAVAGIADAQQHVRSRRAGDVRREVVALGGDVRGLDDEPAAVRHRVAGVHGEVQQDLFDLRAIRLDLIEVRRELQLEHDVLAEQALHQVAGAADDVVEIQDDRLQHLLAAEREQFAGERGGAASGLADAFDVGAARMIGRQRFRAADRRSRGCR